MPHGEKPQEFPSLDGPNARAQLSLAALPLEGGSPWSAHAGRPREGTRHESAGQEAGGGFMMVLNNIVNIGTDSKHHARDSCYL